MKVLLSLFVSATFLFGFTYGAKPTPLGTNVYCFFGKSEMLTKENGGNIVNSCFVMTREGYVVIDSGPTWLYAKEAYEAMQKIKPLKVKYVINTHHHDDHWLGNGFYKSLGAKLIGPESLPFSVDKDTPTRMERSISKEAYAKTEIVYPEVIVKDRMDLKVGDLNFEIIKVPYIGHTDADLIINVPNHALFAGDLIFNDRLLSVRDGSVKGWLKSLELITSFKAPFVIGGHGLDVSKKSHIMTQTYLLELQKAVRNAIDEDVGLEEVTKVVKMEKFSSLNLYDVLHKQNVLTVFQELEFEEEEE